MNEKVFVVFGSLSDNQTFEPIIKELQEKKIPYLFHGLSAHKSPKELEEQIKKTTAKIFIAGAGLASALPGVVASQTTKTVIGITTVKDFDGLDSLLSTMQMPPNIPVLALGPKKPSFAVVHAQNFLEGFESIVLIERKEKEAKQAVQKAEQMLNEFGVEFEKMQKTNYPDKKKIFVDFVPFNQIKKLKQTNSTAIIVPLKSKSSAKDAVQLIGAMKTQLFVGLNRIENAVIGAMQLMNSDGKFEEKLFEFKEQTRKKIVDQNQKEFAQWNAGEEYQ